MTEHPSAIRRLLSTPPASLLAQGGSTRFEHLGPLSVRPEQGKALLFFPGYADGRPDERTLHTAEDAVRGQFIYVYQGLRCTCRWECGALQLR